MIGVSVNIDLSGLDNAQVVLQNPRPLMAAGGKALEKCVKQHFLERDKEPSPHGWPKQHFWVRKGRNNTQLTEITSNSATVSIASPEIAHRLYGGTITPKRGKMLALPLTAKAYSSGSPREGGIPGLFLLARKGKYGRAFLAIKKGKGKNATIEVQYLLIKSVTHQPDPNTLPTAQALSQAVIPAVESALNRSIRRIGSAP